MNLIKFKDIDIKFTVANNMFRVDNYLSRSHKHIANMGIIPHEDM